MFKALMDASLAMLSDFSLAEFGKSIGSFSWEMEMPHYLCCPRRTECVPVSNHPLGPHLPPSVTRQFTGADSGKSRWSVQGILVFFWCPLWKIIKMYLLPDASFQVPELPCPGLRGFSKFNSENLLDLHQDPSRPVISLTLPGGL